MHMRRAWWGLLTIVMAALAANNTARAAVHEWDVKEVFSNASGSIQYIELFTASGGQTVIGSHDVVVIADGVTSTFTLPANLTGDTANRHLLIATPEFAALGIVTPDYVLPCGRFFDPAAASIRVEFSSYDSITIEGGLDLPVDGSSSIEDSTASTPTTTLATGTASPTNFIGDTGSVDLSSCLTAGTCSGCDDGMFCNGTGTCVGSACMAGTAPCAVGLTCDEDTDTCECDSVADCDDGNECTTDSCATVCIHTNNTNPCDDGMFCTETDTCGGGMCVGAGDPCGGDQCNEGSNDCGDCRMNSDCDDGMFCNGAEVCTDGVCGNAATPACDPSTEMCDETGDACIANCGNGAIDGSEVCDDGNDDDGDGCADDCTIEDGFDCDAAEPSVCTPDPVEEDAGGNEMDAGMTGETDAGMTMEEGGCSCRAISSSSPSRGAIVLALIGLAIAVRRRRR
jgi:MYXO-CTERM domain-containing protein